MTTLLSSGEQRRHFVDMYSHSVVLPEILDRTEVWMATSAVCVVQEAMLLRHLPEGCLTVAKFHSPHRAAAADLWRIHTLGASLRVL